MSTPYAIEVFRRNAKFRVETTVYGQPRETFVYKTERAAIRKVQELERKGYTLINLPQILANLEGNN